MWIELHDTAREHPKVLKLARDLSIKPVHALGHMVSLWTWVLRMAPDGCLESFDTEDLEIAAQWDGDAGAFVEAAISRRLIDETDGVLYIHDWTEFCGTLKTAERVRRFREKKRQTVTSGNVTKHYTGDKTSSCNACNADRPDRPDRPDQTRQDRPDQTDLSVGLSPDQAVVGPGNEQIAVVDTESKSAKEETTKAIDAVISAYKVHHPNARPGPRERKAIAARLAEGHWVETLQDAVDGMHLTPHNLGQNERGQKYLGLELCMRNGDQVLRFAETAERHRRGEQVVLSAKEARGVEATESWLRREGVQ